MSVTVLQRPRGFVLFDCVEATISEAYVGYAVVNYTSHGLIDGDYVYIQSNIESYNGFWYVNIEDGNYFKIRRYATATDQSYVVDATITYCLAVRHGWNSVHLPITYRLSSNLYPTNNSDTSRTVSSFNDDNGYVNLNLSGSIDSGAYPEPFESVKVGETVYQIIEVISTTSITINLAYDSTLSLVGQTVIRHYANYNIKVRVYGGLPSGHTWETERPYELLATLSLIPDDDNQVFFSIHEILKAHIKTRNNLQLDTLPNNIDFFTGFYISTAESYDDSLGSAYTLSTYTTSYTADTFEGIAVNAKLPFKNIHSGNLSEYIMTNSAAKFLTLFTILTYFGCDDNECYQDVSFALSTDFDFTVRETFFIDDVEQTTNDTDITNFSHGVYRRQVSYDCGFDYANLSLIIKDPIDALSTFQNRDSGGPGVDWTLNGSNLPEATTTASTEYAYIAVKIPGSSNVQIDYEFTVTGSATTSNRIQFIAWNDPGLSIINYYSAYNDGYADYQSETRTGSFSFDKPSSIGPDIGKDIVYLGFNFVFSGTDTKTIEMTSISIDGNKIDLSEVKRVNIECGCVNQEIRLTWLNYLGGFDYWNFTAEKEYNVDVSEAETTKANIFNNWPSSYGEYADTIEKQTFRKSKNTILVRSQNVTAAQLDAIKYLRTSPLVQIINSRSDRRTVIVDKDSFTVRKDRQDLHDITFTISYTDEIPSQTC